MINRRTRIMLAAASAAALTGGGIAVAAGGDDDHTERPITGTALEHAREAALDHVGDGRVRATEAGDEEGAYEVEVTRADGTQVDVHLNRRFEILNTRDEDEPGDD